MRYIFILFYFFLGFFVQAQIDMNMGFTDPNAPRQAAPVQAKQVISANLVGDQIQLGDGRIIPITYKRQSLPWPYVEMLEPQGARVVISYDQFERLRTEVPFLWKEAKIDQYMKISVEEFDRQWSIKIMPKKDFTMVIGGSAAPAPTPRAATPAPAGGPSIKTNKTTYAVGENIDVTYSGFSGNSSDWITIIPEGEAENEWGTYQYLGEVSGRVNMKAPSAGTYEILGYFSTGQSVIARTRITVR